MIDRHISMCAVCILTKVSNGLVGEEATATVLCLWYFPGELNENEEIPRLRRKGNWEAERPVGERMVNEAEVGRAPGSACSREQGRIGVCREK